MQVGPRLLGAAALVLAGTSAVSVDGETFPTQAASSGTARPAPYASVLSGTSANASSDPVAERERAVSRDWQREAQQDAADAELQEAAEAQARERNAALAQLAASAEAHAAELASNAWVLPLTSYRITATFGESSSLWANTHTGLDMAAPSGTPIMSIAKGVVTSAGYDGAYGNKTVITLEDGTEIWYGHQTGFSVSPGDQVNSGQTIGSVGATGNVTGPHLHVEVRPGGGDPVDPFDALRVRGLNL